MKVLRDKSQIYKARQELKSKGASCISSSLILFLKKHGIIKRIAIGDKVKSWDVLLTLTFIEQNLKKNEPILDIGCYSSEILISLYREGFTKLYGIDLNPQVNRMPYKNIINYTNGNFLQTNFDNSSFHAVTSTSVIEHGFNSQSIIKEMSSLLKPGGFFIASFDYWPIKIDTSDIKVFGMDWKIFSKNEVINFINDAAFFGLFPVGDITFEAHEKAIEFHGKKFTFAWIVFEKRKIK